MAKLSAHGKELLRVEKETDVKDPNENITWPRVTRAYLGVGNCGWEWSFNEPSVHQGYGGSHPPSRGAVYGAAGFAVPPAGAASQGTFGCAHCARGFGFRA